MRRSCAMGLATILMLVVTLGLASCSSGPATDSGGQSPAPTPPTAPNPQPQPTPQQPQAQDPKGSDTAESDDEEDPEPEYAWVLVEVSPWGNSASGAPSGDWDAEKLGQVVEGLFLFHELTGPHNFVRYYAMVGEETIEYQANQWRGEPQATVHVIYTWTAPPEVIADQEVVTITLHQEIVSNHTDNYYWSRTLGCEARVDTRDLSGPGHVSYFQGTLPDGTAAQTGGRGALSPKFEHDSYKQEVSSIELSRTFGNDSRAAREGERRSIEVKIITYHQVGTRYIYEYRMLD